MGTYRVAQICLNGHVITDSADAHPEKRENFCTKCGAKTIMNCPNCNESIRGYYYVPGVLSVGRYKKPLFCHNCGQPYPWTVESLEAAKELINLDSNLTNDDKHILSKSLNDIVYETPRTQVAIRRFKAITAKALSTTADGLKQLLIEIVSESVKKAIWS